jgi:hypothetical protein
MTFVNGRTEFFSVQWILRADWLLGFGLFAFEDKGLVFLKRRVFGVDWIGLKEWGRVKIEWMGGIHRIQEIVFGDSGPDLTLAAMRKRERSASLTD